MTLGCSLVLPAGYRRAKYTRLLGLQRNQWTMTVSDFAQVIDYYVSAAGFVAFTWKIDVHLGCNRRRPVSIAIDIGDRTFPAAAASVWNSLPESVRASPSLQVFRSRLKTELFARSYSCSD